MTETISPAQKRIIKLLGDVGSRGEIGLTVQEIRKALKLNTPPNALIIKLRRSDKVQITGTKKLNCNYPNLSWTKKINTYGLTPQGQAIYESMVKKQKGIYVTVPTD